MLALVTGGSGFIGSHVVDELREKEINVRVFDMVLPTLRKDVEYYHGSILNLEALRMAMPEVDIIFHLAAVANVKDVFEEPHYSESVNTRGTINVLEAAKRSKCVKRVVYGSTVWVYGDIEVEKVDEETPLPPPSHLYTATKIASEYYCKCYSKLYGLGTTILRYGVPYGPRARPEGVIPSFVEKASRGDPLTIAGDGLQYRKFVYVEDLAEGNVLALKSIAENKIYNLEGSETITIVQIAETIRKIIGNVEITYGDKRPGDFKGKEISNRKALKEIGWKPKVTFEKGLRKYIEWYKNKRTEQEESLARIDATLRETK